MVFYWNNKRREHLLRLVKNIPSLWNKNHLAYGRNDINDFHFNTIGQIIGCSGLRIKRQLTTLIEKYEFYKERNSIKNIGSKKRRKFALATQMQFMDQQFSNVECNNLQPTSPITLIPASSQIIPQTSSQPTVLQTRPLSVDNSYTTLSSLPSGSMPSLLSNSSMPSLSNNSNPSLSNNSMADHGQFNPSPNLPPMTPINITVQLMESIEKLDHLIDILQAGTVFIPPSNPNLTHHQQHFINLMTWATSNLSNENQKLLMHLTIQIYINQSRQ